MTLTETERLIIRSWQSDDLEAYARIVADPDVMQYIGTGKTLSYTEAEAYINRCIENQRLEGWTRFAVEIKATQQLAGFCGYGHYNNELDFGWRYGKEFWGNGYGTEAAHAVLELGVHRFRFPRIVCVAYAENKGSIRIMEKIGMEFEKNIVLNNRKTVQYVKLIDG